jgi:DNA repair exonuclease SbcCD ATPase subunit
MELYYVCLLVVFFAFMATTLNLKKLLELKIRQLELMIGKLTDKVSVLSLSKSKADEKIDELFRRLRSLTADVDGNVELVNKLVLDLEKLEEYMEDRKALDQREERMLSGINNIMSYDASVAREAVKNLEESED